MIIAGADDAEYDKRKPSSRLPLQRVKQSSLFDLVGSPYVYWVCPAKRVSKILFIHRIIYSRK